MNGDREILLRYLDGSLAPDEVETLERRLATDENLRDELTHLESVGRTISSERAEHFGAFFVDRTLKAIRFESAPRAASLHDALGWVFLRTAAAGLVIVMLLSVLNVLDYQGLDVASSWVEAAFGLPSTTVEDALMFGFI